MLPKSFVKNTMYNFFLANHTIVNAIDLFLKNYM